MNRGLLQQIRDLISSSPEKFRWEWYFDDYSILDNRSCNTSCCIAGWAILLGTGMNYDEWRKGRGTETIAKETLGLDPVETEFLFNAHGKEYISDLCDVTDHYVLDYEFIEHITFGSKTNDPEKLRTEALRRIDYVLAHHAEPTIVSDPDQSIARGE